MSNGNLSVEDQKIFLQMVQIGNKMYDMREEGITDDVVEYLFSSFSYLIGDIRWNLDFPWEEEIPYTETLEWGIAKLQVQSIIEPLEIDKALQESRLPANIVEEILRDSKVIRNSIGKI